jgi:hypothetical protein
MMRVVSTRRTVFLAVLLAVAGCSGSTTNDALPPDDGPVADGPSTPGDGSRSDGPQPQQDKRLGDLPYLQHKLTFNESLCAGIGSGTKKSTLRNGTYWSLLVVGEWVKLECSTSKTTYKAQLTVVRVTTWGGITAEEYMADGFSSQANMMQIMQTYYPGITLTDPAMVIRWDKTSPYP